MTRAPGILRSMTFWSGILGMAFLCWSWVEATKPGISYVRIWRLQLSNRLSGVDLHYWDFLYPSFRVELRKDSYPFFFETFPAPFWGRGSGRSIVEDNGFNNKIPKIRSHADAIRIGILRYAPTGDRLLFIPHWLILPGFAAAWSGLLYWRHRRIRRVLASAPAPPS